MEGICNKFYENKFNEVIFINLRGTFLLHVLDDNLFFLKQNSHVLMSTFKA